MYKYSPTKNQIITRIVYKTKRKYRRSIREVGTKQILHKSRLSKSYNPTNRHAYQAFKKASPVKKDRKLSLKEFRRIHDSVFKATRELMLEYEGGVFLERYGYFSLLIIPYGRKGMKRSKYFYDNFAHTDGYTYVPILDSDVGTKSCIKRMIMDRMYPQELKKKFWKLITDEGFRPKNYYSTLKSMYGHKNAKIY